MNMRRMLVLAAVATALLIGSFIWISRDLTRTEPETPVSTGSGRDLGRRNDPSDTIKIRDALFIDQAEVTSLDPLDSFHFGHSIVVHELFDTLTDSGSGGHPAPRLAESWEIDENSRKFTFKIREASFSPFEGNRRRVSSSDVIFTFNRLLHQKSTSLGLPHFLIIEGAEAYHNGKADTISGIEALSDDKVVFRLTQSLPEFAGRLSMPYAAIVSKEAVQKLGDSFRRQPVGSGPYQLKSWKVGEELVIARNPQSWHPANDQAPSEVTLRFYRDPVLAFSDFSSGNLDVLELTSELGDIWKKEKARVGAGLYKEVRYERPIIWFYAFNCANPPLNDPKTRRWLACSVKRAALAPLLPISGRLASRWVPWRALGYDEPGAPQECPSSSEPLHDRFVRPLSLISFNNPSAVKRAEVVAHQLKAAGLKVEVESLPFAGLVQKLLKGEFDLIDLYWGPFYASLENYLSPFTSLTLPPKGNNFGRCVGSGIDSFYGEAIHESDSGKRQALYYMVERNMVEGPPGILSHYSDSFWIVHNYVHRLSPNPLGYREYERWEISRQR